MSYCPEHGGQMNERTAPPASTGEPAPAAEAQFRVTAADPAAEDPRRVAAVVSAIAAEGRPVMFDEVARRSGIARVKLVNSVDLHALVVQGKNAGGSPTPPPPAKPMTPSPRGDHHPYETEGSPLAEAWLRGQGYPVGPPPVDRWTR